MFAIRPEQMTAFAAAAEKDFRDRLRLHLADLLPGKGVEWPDARLRAEIDAGIDKAPYYAFVSEKHVAKFVEVACAYFGGFAAPFPAPAREILNDCRIAEDDRLAQWETWARRHIPVSTAAGRRP